MVTIGRVNKTPISGYDIQWHIPNFFLLTVIDNNESYSSPLFSFAGASWLLKMYPKGTGTGDSSITVFLKRKSSGPPVNLEFSLGLETSLGKGPIEHYSYTFEEADEGYGFVKFPTKDEILERESELLPGGTLTVFCSLKCPALIDDANVQSLRQDCKKVLLYGQNHDLILKVGDKTLHAHQDILRARSRVFESMLTHDMVEKNSGIIDAPDCDPHAMEQFLLYVYSGKVETLDSTNMLSLYYIADKYDVELLKEECRDFIMKSLSLTNICEVIQLALNHSDSNLLESATEYFGSHALNILRSVEWQSFLKDNSEVANELLIKYFEKIKNLIVIHKPWCNFFCI